MTFDEVIEQSKVELGEMVESGRLAIGIFYPHAPYELILAHGFIPTLLRTDSNIGGAYETSLQTFACSLIRNMYSQREMNQLPEVSGFIFPGNTCDSLQNLGDVWRVRFPEDNVFRLTYPVADTSEASIRFLAEELRLLSEKLSNELGQPFFDDEYSKAVDFMQSFREAAQTLYIVRLLVPDIITYSSLASLVRGFLSAPGDGALERVRTAAKQVVDESGFREDIERIRKGILTHQFQDIKLPPNLPRPRIAVLGGMTEPEAIAKIIEILPKTSDSVIVLDILSFGFKTVFTPPPDGSDPFSAMAQSILASPGEPTQEGLRNRVTYLKDLISNLNIHGLIVCEQSFCDPDEFETPSLEKAVSEMNLPIVRLPIDPELSDLSRLGVRIQSFLEQLESE